MAHVQSNDNNGVTMSNEIISDAVETREHDTALWSRSDTTASVSAVSTLSSARTSPTSVLSFPLPTDDDNETQEDKWSDTVTSSDADPPTTTVTSPLVWRTNVAVWRNLHELVRKSVQEKVNTAARPCQLLPTFSSKEKTSRAEQDNDNDVEKEEHNSELLSLVANNNSDTEQRTTTVCCDSPSDTPDHAKASSSLLTPWKRLSAASTDDKEEEKEETILFYNPTEPDNDIDEELGTDNIVHDSTSTRNDTVAAAALSRNLESTFAAAAAAAAAAVVLDVAEKEIVLEQDNDDGGSWSTDTDSLSSSSSSTLEDNVDLNDLPTVDEKVIDTQHVTQPQLPNSDEIMAQQRARSIDLQMTCKDLGLDFITVATANGSRLDLGQPSSARPFYKHIPCLACQHEQTSQTESNEGDVPDKNRTPVPAKKNNILSALALPWQPRSPTKASVSSTPSSSLTGAGASPCLMCGTPSCKKHACPTFYKENIIVCSECKDLFSIDQLLIDCLTTDPQHVYVSNDHNNHLTLAAKLRHMVEIYGRVLSLLQRALPHISDIIHQLCESTARHNKTLLGSSATGIVSGALGIAAAAALLTPAGTPLLITSLVLGGGATTLQTSSAIVERYLPPNLVANRLLALYGMLKSILTFTSTLRFALVRDCVDHHHRFAGYESVLSSDPEDTKLLPRGSLLASRCVVGASLASTVEADVVAAGSTTTAFLTSSVDSSANFVSGSASNAFFISRSAMPVIQVAGGVLSGAALLLEATVMTTTIWAIRAGNPCHKAEALRAIVYDLENAVPAPEALHIECTSYLESLAQRKSAMTAIEVNELMKEYLVQLNKATKQTQAAVAAAATVATNVDNTHNVRPEEDSLDDLDNACLSPNNTKPTLVKSTNRSTSGNTLRTWFRGLQDCSNQNLVDKDSSLAEDEDYDDDEAEGKFANTSFSVDANKGGTKSANKKSKFWLMTLTPSKRQQRNHLFTADANALQPVSTSGSKSALGVMSSISVPPLVSTQANEQSQSSPQKSSDDSKIVTLLSSLAMEQLPLQTSRLPSAPCELEKLEVPEADALKGENIEDSNDDNRNLNIEHESGFLQFFGRRFSSSGNKNALENSKRKSVDKNLDLNLLTNGTLLDKDDLSLERVIRSENELFYRSATHVPIPTSCFEE